jgi:hypothetical protein
VSKIDDIERIKITISSSDGDTAIFCEDCPKKSGRYQFPVCVYSHADPSDYGHGDKCIYYVCGITDNISLCSFKHKTVDHRLNEICDAASFTRLSEREEELLPQIAYRVFELIEPTIKQAIAQAIEEHFK